MQENAVLWIIGGIIIIVVIVISIVSRNKRLKRERLAEEERQRVLREKQEMLKAEIRTKIPELKQYKTSYQRFVKQDKYHSGYDLFKFCSRYKALFEYLQNVVYTGLPNFQEEIHLINECKQTFTELPSFVKRSNEIFINKQIKSTKRFLGDIEGKQLDEQQRKAIVIEEDNQLVVAGAGSGKTTTVAGKVKYLVKRLKVKPSNILLISFTRNSVQEMRERIVDGMGINLSVTTFHKLGLEIIADTQGEKPNVIDLSRKEMDQIYNSFLKSILKDPNYSSALFDFLAFYSREYKSLHDYESESQHSQRLKQEKITGLKLVRGFDKNGNSYSYREVLKSQEEVKIANFLFVNRIKYIYQDSYKYKTASKEFGQYKPDFYLPDYGIYIEHFGIDKNGKVPHWFNRDTNQTAQEKYTAGIEWKRTEHHRNGTTLVETYSWQSKDGILLSNLERVLIKNGVQFNKMTKDELWAYLEQNTPDEISSLTYLLGTFLTLFKSNNVPIKELETGVRNSSDPKRTELFFKILKPFHSQYQSFLDSRSEIDFSDMINQATALVSKKKYKSDFEYILVDEFQDISKSRSDLIASILKQKPSAKLFCVGDDWQSIYRFTGSDIGLFTEFAFTFSLPSNNGFKRSSVQSKIEKTYRFGKRIVEVTSSFILKNRNQIPKELIGEENQVDRPLVLVRFEKPFDGGDIHDIRKGSFLSCLKDIAFEEGNKEATVLALGRYNFDEPTC